FISFFFQAEDGIRALYVTGVQTCALPISTSTIPARNQISQASMQSKLQPCPLPRYPMLHEPRTVVSHPFWRTYDDSLAAPRVLRSEERRVGKEGRSGWWGEAERDKAMVGT